MRKSSDTFCDTQKCSYEFKFCISDYKFDVLEVVDGAPDTIRTCDRWYRKPVLYPAELRAHTIFLLFKRVKL